MAHDAAMCAAHLLADGFCIIPEACSRDMIAELDRDLDARFARTPFCEGDFYGERTKRFGALLRRSDQADALVRHRLVLNVVDAVLGQFCDRIVLNLTQAIEIHPGALAQIPHRDQDMWGLSRGQREYQVNVIWPTTP